MATKPLALQLAFDHWLAHQRSIGRLRRGSSESVYRAMWQALVVWCQARQPMLRLGHLSSEALQTYMASRSGMLAADGALSPRYQQRLRSLVQRVQLHDAWRRQQAAAGPALALAGAARPIQHSHRGVLTASSIDADPPPLHLLPAAADLLQTLLCQVSDDALGRWQRLRDRCGVALQLGAGLGPGDVRSLQLQAVRPAGAPMGLPARWQLQVPANGSAPAHTAPLADWAAGVLCRWIALRQAQALGGPWLLPSTRSGKPWGKVAQYEAARRVLVDAGLDPDGGGSFRLRHSFALRQLRHGHDPAQVARWLGVVDPQVMLRYQSALSGAGKPPGEEPLRQSQAAWPV